MLVCRALRLSSNPSAKVEGNFNVSSDGRRYLIGVFSDPENPFGNQVIRSIAEQSANSPDFEGKVKAIRSMIGQTTKGDIVTAKCEPYDINGRQVNTYTAVVFGHENIETVFRNAGHPIQDVTKVAAIQPVAATEDLA